jgi:lysyl-tRNA synthetase class 2
MKSRNFVFLLGTFVSPSLVLAEPSKSDPSVIVSHIPREHVQSSGLASIGYSKRRHILEIEFVNGAVYRYVDVPPSVYRDLVSAESKARYYVLNIRHHYRSVRVRPRVKDNH